MPYIFDDTKAVFVNSGEKYDENRYTVVRRLFVLIYEKDYPMAATNFNEETIKADFSKFGEVESVKLLKNGKLEAYVTFSSDQTAYLAATKRNKDNKYVVNPADTWHQPYTPNAYFSDTNSIRIGQTGDEEEPAIFKLNNDCLHEILKRCDLETLVNLYPVCKRFKALFEDENGQFDYQHFRKFDELSIATYKDNDENPITIGMIRKYLRRVGPFLNKFVFRNVFGDIRLETRLFQKIVQYVGENIRELDLNYEGNCRVFEACNLSELFMRTTLYSNEIVILKPVLKNLRTLRINGYVTCWEAQHSDFQSLCPSLTKLDVRDSELPVMARHWPSLKSLTKTVKDGNQLDSFIALNPQLTELTLYFCYPYEWDADGLYNLREIERLKIFDCKFESIDLTRFPMLNHLTLQANAFSSTYTLLSNVSESLSLTELTLLQNEFEGSSQHQAIVAFTQKVPNLKKLSLYEYKTQVPDNIIVQILENSMHLSELKISIKINRSLITDIVNVRKSQKQEAPLKLYSIYDYQYNEAEALVTNDDKQFVELVFEPVIDWDDEIPKEVHTPTSYLHID